MVIIIFSKPGNLFLFIVEDGESPMLNQLEQKLLLIKWLLQKKCSGEIKLSKENKKPYHKNTSKEANGLWWVKIHPWLFCECSSFKCTKCVSKCCILTKQKTANPTKITC